MAKPAGGAGAGSLIDPKRSVLLGRPGGTDPPPRRCPAVYGQAGTAMSPSPYPSGSGSRLRTIGVCCGALALLFYVTSFYTRDWRAAVPPVGPHAAEPARAGARAPQRLAEARLAKPAARVDVATTGSVTPAAEPPAPPPPAPPPASSPPASSPPASSPPAPAPVAPVAAALDGPPAETPQARPAAAVSEPDPVHVRETPRATARPAARLAAPRARMRRRRRARRRAPHPVRGSASADPVLSRRAGQLTRRRRGSPERSKRPVRCW